MRNITIVCSTKNISELFIKDIKTTCGLKNVELLIYVNNGEYSLTEIYNRGLKEAANDIIVFVHDDIYFDSKNWGLILLNNFKNNPDFGIIGVAGTNELSQTGVWWSDKSKMFGIVNHESGGNKWTSEFSKDLKSELTDVVVLDGVFFAVNKTKIVKEFDETISGFHYYDISFTFDNYMEDVNIGVCYNIRLTHKSIGQTNNSWEINRILFAEKNKDRLPQKIDYI